MSAIKSVRTDFAELQYVRKREIHYCGVGCGGGEYLHLRNVCSDRKQMLLHLVFFSSGHVNITHLTGLIFVFVKIKNQGLGTAARVTGSSPSRGVAVGAGVVACYLWWGPLGNVAVGPSLLLWGWTTVGVRALLWCSGPHVGVLEF